MGIAAAGDGCAEVEAGTGHQTRDECTGPARGSDRSVCAEEVVGGPAGDCAQKRGRHGDGGLVERRVVVNWLREGGCRGMVVSTNWDGGELD